MRAHKINGIESSRREVGRLEKGAESGDSSVLPLKIEIIGKFRKPKVLSAVLHSMEGDMTIFQGPLEHGLTSGSP